MANVPILLQQQSLPVSPQVSAFKQPQHQQQQSLSPVQAYQPIADVPMLPVQTQPGVNNSQTAYQHGFNLWLGNQHIAAENLERKRQLKSQGTSKP
jgi:hypothetical protein